MSTAAAPISYESPPSGTALRPVAAGERIGTLDVLRGVAILGILTMNIVSFGMVEAAYVSPTHGHGGTGGLAGVAWTLQRLLCDQRFMSIFAMLFGVGLVLANRRADDAGGGLGLHYRRMGVLLGIGMLHAYLLWHGDVLVLYALLGMVVVFARTLTPTPLIWIAAGLISASYLLVLLMGFAIWMGVTFGEQSAEEMMRFTAGRLAAEREAWGGGSFGEVFLHRLGVTPVVQVFTIILYGARTAGLMVLGMALLKLGVFAGNAAARRWLMLGGGLVGGTLAAADVGLGRANGNDLGWLMSAGSQFHYWASIGVALFYVGVIATLAPRLPAALTHPLAAVGQLAISNYLLQTVLCTTFFYGYGLGYFGTLDRGQLMLVVLGVWAIQVTLSVLWLRVFRFGPAEWAWRSLAYLRPQPIVKAAA